MPLVALSHKHPRSACEALASTFPGATTIIVWPDMRVDVVRAGPAGFAGLKSAEQRATVWVGVPGQWVQDTARLRPASPRTWAYLGGPKNWRQVQDSLRVAKAIEAAQELEKELAAVAAKDEEKSAAERAKARATRREERRRLRLSRPPPWFVPDVLQ